MSNETNNKEEMVLLYIRATKSMLADGMTVPEIAKVLKQGESSIRLWKFVIDTAKENKNT